MNTSTENEMFTACYNCTGARMRSLCGMPMPGCQLCETYGKGWGKLLTYYRSKEVTIVDDKGTSTTYIPPTYSCLTCQDAKTTSTQIWDPALVNNSWSDNGAHLMPKFTVPCYTCRKEEFDVEYDRVKKTYFDSKKSNTSKTN